MKLVSKLIKFISLQLYFSTSSQFVQHISIHFSFWKFCPRRNFFGLIWNQMNTATSTVALDKKCCLFNVFLKFWKRHKQKFHGVKSLLYRACAHTVNFSLFIVCAKFVDCNAVFHCNDTKKCFLFRSYSVDMLSTHKNCIAFKYLWILIDAQHSKAKNSITDLCSICNLDVLLMADKCNLSMSS